MIFSELQPGDKFRLKNSHGAVYIKIKSILRVVEEPLMWASIGKQTRINAVFIKTAKKLVGTVTRIPDDMEVERIGDNDD